jgi:hypothetical protein
MAIVSIDSEEMLTETYKAVEIHYGDGLKEVKRFDSGDFVKDWYDCNKFIVKSFAGKNEHVMCSSSVDHFIIDGTEFKSMYLVVDVGKKNKVKLVKEHGAGLEFFVENDKEYTWSELRKRCGDEHKEK